MSTAMSTATATASGSPNLVDNRAAYVGFGSAWILGHGASAVSFGPDPMVALPSWLPMTLLAAGMLAGTVFATRAALRAQRGAAPSDAFAGKLIGLSWVTGFTGLFLAITGLTDIVGDPALQSILWPTGSGLIVGLIYVSEGAFQRNVLHYALGSWLVLVATTGLVIGTPTMFWLLAIAGGGAYAVATVIENHRVATAGT